MTLASAGPPTRPWTFPPEVVAELNKWLGLFNYIALAMAIAAVIIFGMFLALDRERGEPVSARAPHVRGLQIALGVAFITTATSIASKFV